NSRNANHAPANDHDQALLGDRAPTGEATPTGEPAPDNPHASTPGHPDARGTLPMARYLLDLATEDEVQALAAQAPPMTEDQRARLSRLLRLNRRRRIDPAA
ncbi:hypothetical protein, partial [Phytohabitans kaempferiae]